MKYHKQVKIKCLFCGKERYVFYGDKTRGKGKYCNRLCWDKHKRKLPKFIKCKNCGKDFENKGSQRTKRFCSRGCYANYLKGKYPINLKGKRGVKPRTYLKNKRDKHGAIEDRIWRKQVFERDKYVCQKCKKAGKKLQAHHIKSFSKHPELRLDINNGITLCIKCHRETDNYGSKART